MEYIVFSKGKHLTNMYICNSLKNNIFASSQCYIAILIQKGAKKFTYSGKYQISKKNMARFMLLLTRRQTKFG